MKISMLNYFASGLQFFMISWASANSNNDLPNDRAKVSNKMYSSSRYTPTAPRFISFDSEGGNIDIALDFAVPFLSIPLGMKRESGDSGNHQTLVNIDPKALSIGSFLIAMISFVVPLLTGVSPSGQYHNHYRSEGNSEWSQVGDMLNEVFFNNNYIAPCMQRVVCMMVSSARYSTNPTNIDKIIDGLSSLKWFDEATNGTVLQDAINKGRQGNDCSTMYKNCVLSQKVIKKIMTQIGIV